MRRALLVLTAALAIASLGVQISYGLLGHGRLLGAVELFDMRNEGNVPAWFSTVLLLACSATLGVLWRLESSRGGRDSRYWGGLSLLFAAASIDEAAGVHEIVGYALSGGDSVHVYLVPGTLLLGGVALVTAKFVSRLRREIRQGLVWGFAIWVAGAVALELVEPIAFAGENRVSFEESVLQTAQDVAELTGVIVILHALVVRASESVTRAEIIFKA